MKRFFLMGLIVFGITTAYAQNARYVKIKDEKSAFSPRGFYISGVVDDREDAASIGTVRDGGQKANLEMQNGVAGSLKTYLERGLKQDRAGQAVTLHVTKMEADARKKGGKWDIKADLNISFYVGDNKLVDLAGNGHAVTPEEPAEFYESFIRKTIDNDLERFDEWWSNNKSAIVTSNAVKVNVRMATTTDKPNCIVYSLNRPLHIPDFEGPVQGRSYEMAMTASGIGITYADEVENGHITLNVTITPYFNKANSWFKEEGRKGNVLAHEQTHFDIAAIKACELAEKIRSTAFTKDNYERLLEDMQKQNAKDSKAEEETYDTETNHGTIPDKQLEWQNRISARVRAVGCY